MDDGWIKMFRSFLDWEWYGDTNMVRLFLHLLLKANYEDKRWCGKVIRRGQLVTSLASLSGQTGLTYRRLRTCLERLEQTNEIERKTTNKFTIITVCKYCDYQQVELPERQTSDKQTTNKRQTNDNNIRNKEIKNNIIEAKASTSLGDAGVVDFDGIKEFFNRTMAGKAIPCVRLQLSDRRKSLVRARIMQYGIEAVYEVITKASRSTFLNGGGHRGFVADFEWLMRPNCFPKILDGNYDDRQTTDTRRNERDDTKNDRAGNGADPLARARVYREGTGTD